MDLPDLTGIGPVMRLLAEIRAEPVVSSQLASFRRGHRHGSATAMAILLLARTTMGPDRALLAVFLLGYMYVGFCPTQEDLQYQTKRWSAKLREMNEGIGRWKLKW